MSGHVDSQEGLFVALSAEAHATGHEFVGAQLRLEGTTQRREVLDELGASNNRRLRCCERHACTVGILRVKT